MAGAQILQGQIMNTMKAIGYKQAGDIERADSLVDITLPTPIATGRDQGCLSQPNRHKSSLRSCRQSPQ